VDSEGKKGKERNRQQQLYQLGAKQPSL